MSAPPTGLSRQHRLTRSRDFGRVFAGADRSADCFFTVLARPNGGPVPRLGLAISKRAAKRAVDRNRLKRLAREAFRHRRGRLPSCDYVVLARPGAAQSPNGPLRASLDKHFDRLTRQTGKAEFNG